MTELLSPVIFTNTKRYKENQAFSYTTVKKGYWRPEKVVPNRMDVSVSCPCRSAQRSVNKDAACSKVSNCKSQETIHLFFIRERIRNIHLPKEYFQRGLLILIQMWENPQGRIGGSKTSFGMSQTK